MKITALNETPGLPMEMEGVKGVTKQVPLSKEDGAPLFSFRVFTVEPGGYSPLHQHPFEHLIYILEGNGILISEGEKENPIQKGNFIMVLPDELHQLKNASDQTQLQFLCAVPKDYE